MTRWPELVVFLFGVTLRLSLIANYDHSWGYDAWAHWQVVEWMVQFKTTPNTETLFEAYHPPLFYGLSAWLITNGWTWPMLKAIPILCGLIRLGLMWLGFELYLPRFRSARLAALALAAVLPVSVHMDGMVFGEGLSCLLHAVVLLLVPLAFRKEGLPRFALTIWLGFLLGLALLTKISALVTLGTLGLAVVLEFVLVQRPLRRRFVQAGAWILAAAIPVAMGSWYFDQNVRQYEKPVVASYDLPTDSWRIAPQLALPVLDRRTLGYVFGWSDEIFKYPYFPSGLSGRPRFFPTLMATAVVDYWAYAFSGWTRPSHKGEQPTVATPWGYRDSSMASIFAGLILLVATTIAWIKTIATALRRRDMGSFALTALPFFAVLGALHFAISFPADHCGIIKATYLLFASPPLFALYGLAVEWSTKAPTRWPVFVLLIASLGAVGWYSTICRISKYYPWEIPQHAALDIQGSAEVLA